MADDLDQLLSAHASEDDAGDIDAMLSAHATETPAGSRIKAPSTDDLRQLDEWNKQPQELPWYKRAAQGAADPILGAGQLLQNIPGVGGLLEKGREGISAATSALSGSPNEHIPTSTDQFNQLVRDREANYQGERKNAGQDGFDVARLGGAVANPVSWLAPGSAAGSGVMSAVRAGATQGAFQALLQPVTDTGSFLYDKGMQTLMGGAAGGTLSAALAGLRPIFGKAKEAFGKVFGQADEAAQAAGAEKITEDTLKTAGVDPAKVDRNLYAAIKTEVQDALKVGQEPDPAIMARRADAGALPVPIELTRGQASRDAFQYSWEKNQGSKLPGVGLPLSERLVDQNRKLIENLNVLGAKNAPSTYDASQALITHLEGVDAQARQAIDAAYKGVRDSAGRPALMDQDAFQKMAREGLESGQLTEFVPDAIKNQYNAIAEGRIPLTVDTAQTLDRVWSAEQRAAQGSAKIAIGKLRDAINNAPVTDQLGADAMTAYKAARSMAKHRFDTIEAVPAYKAVVDGTEPDKFFQKYVQGANVSELAGLKDLAGPDNTAMLQKTLLGNLKKHVLSSASDEDGSFSQAALNKFLHDDVQAPRIKELFKGNDQTLSQLYRLGRVSEDIKRFPENHSVNTSNTAVTAASIVGDMAKSEAGSALLSMVPYGRAAKAVTETAKKQAAEGKAVNEALRPGVTKEALKKAPPSTQMRKLGSLLSRGGAAYAVSDDDQ